MAQSPAERTRKHRLQIKAQSFRDEYLNGELMVTAPEFFQAMCDRCFTPEWVGPLTMRKSYKEEILGLLKGFPMHGDKYNVTDMYVIWHTRHGS